MKTVTYQAIQDQAAEMAGRPSGKLPNSEQAILLMLAQTELKVMWTCQSWPELMDNFASGPFTPVNTNGVLTIDKMEGTATEIGDVTTILTADPRQPCVRPCGLNFEIGNGQIILFPPLGWGAQVWLDFQKSPTDLMGVNADPATLPVLGFAGVPNTLSNLLLPARFYQPLSFMMASRLLTIDGLLAQASGFKGLAQENLDWQAAQPEMRMPEWRGRRTRG